jgi:hypothetical protein
MRTADGASGVSQGLFACVGNTVTISMSLSSQHHGMSLEPKYRRDGVIDRALMSFISKSHRLINTRRFTCRHGRTETTEESVKRPAPYPVISVVLKMAAPTHTESSYCFSSSSTADFRYNRYRISLDSTLNLIRGRPHFCNRY